MELLQASRCRDLLRHLGLEGESVHRAARLVLVSLWRCMLVILGRQLCLSWKTFMRRRRQTSPE
jgi:hypothetical protein